jgi:hypothetical protein
MVGEGDEERLGQSSNATAAGRRDHTHWIGNLFVKTASL